MKLGNAVVDIAASSWTLDRIGLVCKLGCSLTDKIKSVDLKSLARQIKERGFVLEGTLSASGFVESSKQLTGTIENISDEILENNYIKFVKVLENHVRNKKVENLTSKELVKEFLSTKLKLYEGGTVGRRQC